MTYTSDEAQSDGSYIIELHKFTTPERIYNYTSHSEDFTFVDDYEAIAISRSKGKSGTQSDNVSMDITVPYDCDLMVDLLSKKSPPDYIRYELKRVHYETLTSIVAWRGVVIGASGTGRSFKLRVPSVFSSTLGSQIPSAYIQTQCNHILYDDRCGISELLYSFVTNIDAVANETEITLNSVDGKADQWFRGGTVKIGNYSRLITDQTGKVIKFNYPFPASNVGDAAQITAGCNRSESDCKTKFSNWENFSGQKFIPLINVFSEGVQ